MAAIGSTLVDHEFFMNLCHNYLYESADGTKIMRMKQGNCAETCNVCVFKDHN